MRWSLALLAALFATVSAQIQWATSFSAIETVGDQVELFWTGGNGQQVTIQCLRSDTSDGSSSIQLLFNAYVGADSGSYVWTVPSSLYVSTDPGRTYSLALQQEGVTGSKYSGEFSVRLASSVTSSSSTGTVTSSSSQTTPAGTTSSLTTEISSSETISEPASSSFTDTTAGASDTSSTGTSDSSSSRASSATNTAASSTSSSSEAAASNPGQDGNGSSGLSTGAIVGIVVGVAAVTAIAGLILFFIWRRKQKRKAVPANTSPHNYQYSELSTGNRSHAERHELGRDGELGTRYEKDGHSVMAEMPVNTMGGRPPGTAMYEMPGDGRYR